MDYFGSGNAEPGAGSEMDHVVGTCVPLSRLRDFLWLRIGLNPCRTRLRVYLRPTLLRSIFLFISNTQIIEAISNNPGIIVR